MSRLRPGVELPLVLLAFVLGLDLLWSLVRSPSLTTEFALIDEPAHLTTCLLLLLALVALTGTRPSSAFVAAAIAMSVAIDLDHLPRYLGWDGLTAGTPRPYTHSLLTPALLLLAGALSEGRYRDYSLGAAFGVCAHLFRDVCTGPGVALLWPVSSAAIRLPYVFFAVALTLVALLIAARSAEGLRSPRPLPRSGAVVGENPRA